MLSKDNFSKEHIDELRAKYKRGPALLERTIYGQEFLLELEKMWKC